MVFNSCCQLASPSSPFPNCQRQLDSAHTRTHRARLPLFTVHTARSRSSFAHSRAHARMHLHTRSHTTVPSINWQLDSATTPVSSARARNATAATHAAQHSRHALAHLRAHNTRAKGSRTLLAHSTHAMRCIRTTRSSRPNATPRSVCKHVRAICTRDHMRATHYRAARHGSPCATPTPRTTRARLFSLHT
jgi:hypothetical protein